MFPDISYLDWMVGRPERADYDLGCSDLARPGLDAAASESDSSTPESDADGSGSDRAIPPALADVLTPDATARELLAEAYGVAPENVLVTAGATHANFLAIAAALPDGEPAPGTAGADAADGEAAAAAADRVLVEKPGYEPLLATPRGLGATVDRFRRPAADGYALDPGRVAGAVVEDTALVAVTNRHNPSGRLVGRDALAEAASAVEDAASVEDGTAVGDVTASTSSGDADGSARLLVDEVYAPFGVDPGDGPFGGPTAAGLDGVAVTSSLTKFFGFGGVRVGWLVADAEFVARARSVAHHVPAVAEPSERLARRALADADRLAEAARERVRENRESLSSFVAGRDDLSGRLEPGCPYAFLEHESADGTEVADAAWEQGVLVVPGRFFDDPDRFRVAACRDPETVRAGLDRLGAVLDGLSG